MRERGTNAIVRSWEQGPFSALAVPPIPSAAVELMDRALGRRVDVDALVLWERMRLFVGYAGPDLPPQVAQLGLVIEPEAAPQRPQARPESPVAAGQPAPSPSAIADDLGD